MALISSDSCCAICNQQLGSAPIFGTWGVFLADEDPLVGFCDAPFHWSCYVKWPERERFAKAYFAFWVAQEKVNPSWAKLFGDDEVFVTVGLGYRPSDQLPAVSEVSVRLAATGSDLRVPTSEWERWLEGGALHDSELQPLELDAIRAVLPRLKTGIPSVERAARSVDWTAKQQLYKSQRWEQVRCSNEEHNAKCRDVHRQIQQDGLTCPHCGRYSRDFRFLDVDNERQSYFICRSCTRSFGPGDLKL